MSRRAFVLLVMSTSVVLAASTTLPPPVVLMNGLAGSVMHAKLDHLKSVPHALCEKDSKEKFFKLWVSAEELLPMVIDCTFDNMRIIYNSTTKKYRNKEGVTIDGSVDWGGVGGLEYLDPGIRASGYFHGIIDKLKSQLNYTVNQTLRAHHTIGDWHLMACHKLHPVPHIKKDRIMIGLRL